MRKLAIAMLALAIGGACSTSSATTPRTWNVATETEAREAFFSGYGPEDSFGNCIIDFVIDSTNGPDEVTASRVKAIQPLALEECEYLLYE